MFALCCLWNHGFVISKVLERLELCTQDIAAQESLAKLGRQADTKENMMTRLFAPRVPFQHVTCDSSRQKQVQIFNLCDLAKSFSVSTTQIAFVEPTKFHAQPQIQVRTL